MQLSLSLRIAETMAVKDRGLLPFEELAPLAASAGYRAVCMRASQASIETPASRLHQMRRTLDQLGLAVSMVTGTVALAANTPDAEDALRDIAPHLDLAHAFGASLVRVMVQREDQLPLVRRAADQARERGVSLAHQTHTATLFETVDECLEMLRRIDRPNVGITYEPANLLAVGDDYGVEALRRLAPHLLNVYLQNYRFSPAGAPLRTRLGVVKVETVPLDAPGGVDFRRVFDGLHAVGYQGYVTVHQTAVEGLPVADAAQRYYSFLAPLIALRLA
jgi:sugar phosphate isomerase/epimerase